MPSSSGALGAASRRVAITLRSVLERPEHRPTEDHGAHGMDLVLEPGRDAEVAAAAA